DDSEVLTLAADQVPISALRAGDMDCIILVPESEIDRLQNKEKDKIETFIFPEGVFWYFIFNHTRPPLNDFKVRKAVQLAADPRAITEATTLNHGAVYEQPFVKASRWHYD